MIALLFLLLCTVSAHPSSVYSRVYLRGLKRVENERIQAELITRGITYVEDAVFRAAKRGEVRYTTEPFEGCDAYIGGGVDKDVCETVVTRIQTLVTERFPDSDLTYDANTKQYTLHWG
jgi:hypothetical protein